jgi:hypothetical protein
MMDIHPYFPEVERGYNVSLSWMFTHPDNSWHSAYGNVEHGADLGFYSLGNKKVLGSAISVMPLLKFGLIENKSIEIQIIAAAGLAFFNNPHHAAKNPENLVIGSYITASVKTGMELGYRFGQNSIYGGLSFTHFSNGHFSVPNIGANIPSLQLGYSRQFVDLSTEENSVQDTGYWNRRIGFQVIVGTGFHEMEGTVIPADGPRYPVYHAGAYLRYRLGKISVLHTGLDWNYYTAYFMQIYSMELYFDRQKMRSQKLIYFVGHEFLFGKLALNTQFGFNLYSPLRNKMMDMGLYHKSKLDRLMSATIGFNYYFANAMSGNRKLPFAGIAVRSIGGKADYVQLNLGYVF